jgi:uncharacterized YkwD family protein
MKRKALRYILILTLCISTAGVYLAKTGEFSHVPRDNFQGDEEKLEANIFTHNVTTFTTRLTGDSIIAPKNIVEEKEPTPDPEPEPVSPKEQEPSRKISAQEQPIPDTATQPDPVKKQEPEPAPAETTPAPQPQPEPDPAVEPTPVPQPQPEPVPETHLNELAQEEKQMLDLINSERTSRGILPLQFDIDLTSLARLKSQDMVNLNYFAHESPTYGSPFEMMKSFGITYCCAAENISGNSGVAAAHTKLMASAGHRANILDSRYTNIGIGIVRSEKYGFIFTQMFIGN